MSLLSQDELNLLQPYLKQVTYDNGATILTQGEPAGQVGRVEALDISKTLRRHLITGMIGRVRRSNNMVQDEHRRSQVITQEMLKDDEGRFGELMGQSESIGRVRERLRQLASDSMPVALLGERGVGKHHAGWQRLGQAAGEGTILLTHADDLPPDQLAQILQGAGPVRIVMTAHSLPPFPAVERVELPPTGTTRRYSALDQAFPPPRRSQKSGRGPLW